jgi:hypothetical protein
MKPNVGERESVGRIVLGIAALSAAIFVVRNPVAAALLGVVGASGVETGVSRYCPINDLLGVDNAPRLSESPIHRQIREGYHA